MKTSDWYTRALLAFIAGLLLVIAAELHLAAPFIGPAAPAGLAGRLPAQGLPVQSASWHPTAAADEVPVMNVRIVGYRYDTGGGGFDDIRIGGSGCGNCNPGLPILMIEK